MNALTQKEVLDWLAVVITLEATIRSTFEATMFNGSCYMNHSYREVTPDPHVHWWAVLRYDHHVTVNGRVFQNPDFGSPYDHYRWEEMPAEIHQQVAKRIQYAVAM